MRASRSMLSLLVLATIATPGLLSAQTPAADAAPYIETFDVRLHNVDVVVTDRAGNAVHGLRTEDFEVTEAGRRQTITHFEAIGGAPTPGAVAASRTDAEAATDSSAKRFVFFIDEMTLHPHTRAKLVEHAGKLIRSSMRPGDQAMIVTPAGPEKIALSFTGDVAAITSAIDNVITNQTRGHTTAQARRERQFLERELSTADHAADLRLVRKRYAQLVNARVEQRLGQLRSVVVALAEVPGRKALILITESLSATPGYDVVTMRDVTIAADSLGAALPRDRYGDWTDQRPAIRDIARKASTNGITIYGLQPEFGLALTAPGGVESRAAVRATRQDQAYVNETIEGTEITLSTLADLTGGRWYRGDGPLDNAFAQVATDLSAYYSLGYPAPEGPMDVGRKIAVQIKGRPDLRVRFRKEVIKKSPAREMTDQVVANLLVPRRANELGVMAVADKPVDERGDSRLVAVAVRVPMDKLLFLQDSAGYKARMAVHYAAVGETAEFMAGQNNEEVITLTAEQYREIAGKSWLYTVNMRIPQGQMKLAVGVMDVHSRLSGFQTLDIAGSEKPKG